jgi:hypothetical protein
MTPTFNNPATHGQVKLYALHERKDDFALQIKDLTQFLPEKLLKTHVEDYAMHQLDELCHLGMFVAYPEEFVVALAFMIAAVKRLQVVSEKPIHCDRNDPYWVEYNALKRKVCCHISSEIGTDATFLAFWVHRMTQILKVHP